MKILFINCTCGLGSTGRICTDLAKQLSQQGHVVKIAYGRQRAVAEEYREFGVRIGNGLDVKVHAFLNRITDRHAFYSAHATKQFLQWAKEFNPDVLWLHNIHGYYIHVGLLFEWIKSRPEMKVKWTLHDCWAFTGHCAHFDLIGCEKWKTQCENCPQIKEYPASLFADNSKKNFFDKRSAFGGVKDMALITPSKWLANLAKESFLQEYPVKTIYNGIDLNVFKPATGVFKKKYGLEGERVILSVAYGFGQRKGLDDLIELAKKLPTGCRLVLVGVDEQDKKQLPPSVFYLEKTENVQELVEAYSDADVFLNLTYEDTFPTVNLESLACGTPVVTYRTGGSPESLNEECGYVVEKGNTDAVLECITIFKKTPKTVEACCKQAERFTLNAMLEGYIREITEC